MGRVELRVLEFGVGGRRGGSSDSGMGKEGCSWK